MQLLHLVSSKRYRELQANHFYVRLKVCLLAGRALLNTGEQTK